MSIESTRGGRAPSSLLLGKGCPSRAKMMVSRQDIVPWNFRLKRAAL